MVLCQMTGVLFAQGNISAKDWFLTGTAKYKCHACALSIQDFTKAIELDRNYAEAYYGRSLAYSCVNDYPSALIDIDRAIHLAPNQVLYREGKARIKLAAGKYSEANLEFQSALRMDSLCWQAWYGIAEVQRNLDSTTLSRNSYEKAIAINPDFTMAYVGAAEVKLEEGSYDEAMVNLLTASQLSPEYHRVYELRSRAQLLRGNYVEAIEDASKATELNPNNEKAYYYRAEAYMATEEYNKADLDYITVLSYDKRDAMSWYKRGYCNEKFGDLVAARKYYGKALKRGNNILDAFSNRAAIWEKFGKYKKALLDLNQSMSIAPDDLSLRLRRAFLYLKMEEVSLATDEFVTMSQTYPESAEARYGLGLARFQIGNVKDACEAWRQAATLGSKDAVDQVVRNCHD